MIRRSAALPLVLGMALTPALWSQKQPRNGGRAAAPKAQSVRPPARGENRTQPNSRPEQALDRVSRMTPEEREKWLAKQPPARRQRIEQNLREIQKVPPAELNRVRTRLELLNSLPPQRQNQVRRSVKQFLDMPEERKAIINQELQRMTPLPDEERRAHMNTEEFRNRYSANEQQMMGNLIEIQPQQ